MNKQDGLTLVELIGVVVILAILLGVAIPSYSRTKERNYYRTATTILQTIYSGERAYYFTKTSPTDRRYYAPTGNTNAAWDPLFMDAPNLTSTGITFSVTLPTPTSFTATAERTSGPCDDKKVSINQTGDLNHDLNWRNGTC